MRSDPPRSGAVAVVAGAALLLTAFNLRPGVPSVGALLRDLQAGTGMSTTAAGVLTTLPTICFGVFALLGGVLGRRLGTARALAVGMALTALGLGLRAAVDTPGAVIAWTVPALAGMGVGNVLLPVAVKAWFPERIGRATGAYSLSIVLGTAIAAAVSVPVAEALGSWRFGLGVWALPPLLALPPLVWLARGRDSTHAEEDVPDPAAAATLTRNPRVWAFAGFFGLQSISAYVMFGWLPTIYQDAGIPADTAGLLLSLVIALGAPLALVLPIVAARRDDQRAMAIGLTALIGLAYAGLIVAPAGAPWVWAALLGVGFGVFPFALLLIGLRASTARGVVQLSALTQGAGYLLAAGGPLGFGALRDVTGDWTVPLLVLAVLLVPQAWCGWVIGRPGHVDAAAG
jgi:MFS transporter, CP family, cyanate transporter